jgi:endonuclease YncB( thermonuclease family)
MNFRRKPPKRTPNQPQRNRKAKSSKSFGKSLAFIGIPAALIGSFTAAAVNLYAPNSDIARIIRDVISSGADGILNGDNSADTAREDDSSSNPNTPFAEPPRNSARLSGPPDIVCRNPKVTDGDTLRCGDIRIRLEGIDSPEMGGKCRPGRQCVDGDPDASKANLQRLVSRDVMECTESDRDHYGRIVARCVVAKVDLSCEQVRTGHAEYRYSRIDC